MFNRTLVLVFLTVAALSAPAFAGEPRVKETCLFGRCRREAPRSDGLQQFAAEVISNQRLQIREAQLQSELILRQLEVQTRLEGMLVGRWSAPQAPQFIAIGSPGISPITPAYPLPAPTSPYNVPAPTSPYNVPAPTSPYAVPAPTAPYPIQAPTSPYNVPGPSYEFRLQSPTGGSPSGMPAPSGGFGVPAPGGISPLQPAPSPTNARTAMTVAWARSRR